MLNDAKILARLLLLSQDSFLLYSQIQNILTLHFCLLCILCCAAVEMGDLGDDVVGLLEYPVVTLGDRIMWVTGIHPFWVHSMVVV